MIILGLTGSIGMGKSTIATMLKSLNIPVHDADACVHDLLSVKNPASLAVAVAFPYYEFPDLYERKTKAIKRKELGALVFHDDEKRARLEGILHPLVRKSQADFIRAAALMRREIICLDIPLLFETGAQTRVDYTLCITAPAFIQRARVMARPNMNEGKFAAILSRQMQDGEKRARADFVIRNGLNRAHTMKELKTVLQEIRERHYPVAIDHTHETEHHA